MKEWITILASMLLLHVNLSAARADDYAQKSGSGGMGLSKPHPVKIMTWNICHCAASYYDASSINPARTADAINAAAPDFVCLQEVDYRTTRSGGIDQTALLAESTGMRGVFAKAINYGGGGYGVAILSKDEAISTNRVALAGDEARVLLVCEYSDMFVATSHLDNNAAKRLESIATITDELAKCAESKPVFFMGDLNATPQSETMGALKRFVTVLTPESGIATLNSHRNKGDYVIDYITIDSAHKDDYILKDAYLIDERNASDHAPLAVELYRRPAASELGWIDEAFLTTGRTGSWNPSMTWNAGSWTASLNGEKTFTPNAVSGGSPVAVDVTVSFDTVAPEVDTPPEGVQGAIWLGVNGNFQVWTMGGWKDVAATGVTPETGVDYTFRFTFDYAALTYSVTVDSVPLVAIEGGATDFLLAASGASISSMRFKGNGMLTAIAGEYFAVEGFSDNEVVVLQDNSGTILDAAKAAWLTKCAILSGSKAAVSSAAAGLSQTAFDKAYLVNVNIGEDAGYSFGVSDIRVFDDRVEIDATLVRNAKAGDAINGMLKFYGAAAPEALNAAEGALGGIELDGADFACGDTATATIPLQGEAPPAFFKAAIE